MKTVLFTIPFVLLSLVSLMSCSSTKKATGSATGNFSNSNKFALTEISTDATYGYAASNPINVGGIKESKGPSNQRRFLNALAGPNGEEISYSRIGSCCPFKSENGLMGGGLLDQYEIKWQGQDKPVILFINFYDHGPLKAPKGFTLR